MMMMMMMLIDDTVDNNTNNNNNNNNTTSLFTGNCRQSLQFTSKGSDSRARNRGSDAGENQQTTNGDDTPCNLFICPVLLSTNLYSLLPH